MKYNPCYYTENHSRTSSVESVLTVMLREGESGLTLYRSVVAGIEPIGSSLLVQLFGPRGHAALLIRSLKIINNREIIYSIDHPERK